MSIRYWLFAAALGLTFWGSGQAQEQENEPEGGGQEEQATPFPLPLPVQIIESEEATETRQRQTEEAREREIEDLRAQQGMNAATQAMNEATQRMANYALWSTIIVGVGTALLVWTLLLTRQANFSAREAVEETRRIGQAQLRAYVYKTGTDVHIANNIEGEMAYMFSPVFSNLGQTPADNCFFVVSSEIRTDGEGPSADGLGEGHAADYAPGVRLGPQGTMTTRPRAFLRSEVEKASRGECGLFVMARVDYIDHTGAKRFVEICDRVYVLKDGLDKEPFAKADLFRIVPYGNSNQAT